MIMEQINKVKTFKVYRQFVKLQIKEVSISDIIYYKTNITHTLSHTHIIHTHSQPSKQNTHIITYIPKHNYSL